jgi:hypothetical protein
VCVPVLRLSSSLATTIKWSVLRRCPSHAPAVLVLEKPPRSGVEGYRDERGV